ncbi:MAG: DUF3795 domain-containing protein [Desulfotomaculaceae bacterium]|nr:DUF3795 domain-containing protein [Desulfotomaculaceae bacterium]
MKITSDITLVAPCGIFCGECEAYKCKDDSALMERMMNSKVLKKEMLPCPGCRAIKGNCLAVDGTCATYACVIEHEVDFCFECPEFPCAKLNPAADRAEVLPHNIKVFNLCCIEHQGLEKFLESIPTIKQRYYRGKMLIGQGPQLK